MNTLVSLRQASLGQRTYQAHKRRKRRYSEMNEEQKAALDERSKARETTSGKTSSKAVMGAVAFTLSMQALFGVSYYDAKDTEAQAACTASASAHYDDYAATHQEDNLEPKAGYIQRECSTD